MKTEKNPKKRKPSKQDPKTKCGFIAIVGRPNVGKSTLLNNILGRKISIISPKPQTTRHRILGIKTTDLVQAVYVDTPGLHKQTHRAINRYMNRTAISALHDVDVVLFVVEALHWKADDRWVLDQLAKKSCPVILVVNKSDKVKSKLKLLPYLEQVKNKMNFAQIIPISALSDFNVTKLEELTTDYLPYAPFMFPKEQITDYDDRFLASEIIREKLLFLTEQEVPYAITIEIEQFEFKEKILHISALIWVEKAGQKAIVIGENGGLLKKVGQQSRLELEKLFDHKIFLRLWVKVKSNWSDDERALKSLGYTRNQ